MSEEKADDSHSAQVQPEEIWDVETNEFVPNRLLREDEDYLKTTKKPFAQLLKEGDKYNESRTARVKPLVVTIAKTSGEGGGKAWKQHVEMKNVKNREGQVSVIQEIIEEPEEDGTELDFNVSVYSQDEADSEDISSHFMRRPFQSFAEGSTIMHYNSYPMCVLQDPKLPPDMERVHNEDYMGPSYHYASLQPMEKERPHCLHDVVNMQHNLGTLSKVHGKQNTIDSTSSDDSITLEESKANDIVSVLKSDWKNEPGPSKSKHDAKRNRNGHRKPFAKKEKHVFQEEDTKRKFLHGHESPSRESAVAVKKAYYGYPQQYMYDRGTAGNAAPVPVCSKNSDGLQQLQNYVADDECYHLSVDGDRSTSPKLVMGSKQTQNIMTCNQSNEKSNFTTFCELWKNEASPSQIKLESGNKKEKYMKSILKSKMQDSSFEKATSSEFCTASTSSGKQPMLWTFPCRAQRGNYNACRGVNYQEMLPSTTDSPSQVTDLTWHETKASKFVRSYLPSSWKSAAAKTSSEQDQTYKPAYDDSEFATRAYCTGFIDSHCHLDFLFQRISHFGSFPEYKASCLTHDPFPVSFEGCVSVFCEPWNFRKVSWWEDILSNPEIWGAFGCHPHYVSRFQITEELHLRHALLHTKVVALGEIGLDYSEKNNECKDLQQKAFRRQVEIALEFKKPLVIHCRDAHADCISIMKEMVPPDYIIHRHCFTDSWEEAKEWMSTFCNLFLGFTGLVTQANRRARLLQDVVRKVPLEKILLETDAPYFRPNGFGYSHPGMAIHVAAQIAYLKNLDIEVVLEQTRKNTQKMYGI